MGGTLDCMISGENLINWWRNLCQKPDNNSNEKLMIIPEIAMLSLMWPTVSNSWLTAYKT